MPRTLDAYETRIDEYLEELCRVESGQGSVDPNIPPKQRSVLRRLGSWFMWVATYESPLDTLRRRDPQLFIDFMMYL